MANPPYVPEISYGDTSPDTVAAGIIASVEASIGRTLYAGDPLRLFSLALAGVAVGLRNMIDEGGRQNLLQYATGSNLDALGSLIGVSRLAATGAKVTLRFTADAPAVVPIGINAGTRATPDGTLMFATDYLALIEAGSTYVDIPATCQTVGVVGDGFTAGEIAEIVDPIAHIISVSNTTTSADGADVEADAAYQARIRLGLARFSVAGPTAAYEYFAQSASAEVSDVYVDSPSAGNVNVYILGAAGALPSAGLITTVTDALTPDDVRPLTDNVTVLAPTASDYAVNITYYISTANAANAASIQTAVSAAVDAYTSWQGAQIGRDINPDVLIAGIIGAGAKRVTVTSPVFTALHDTPYVPVLSAPATVTYGGLEDG